jgi:hypothetical protein
MSDAPDRPSSTGSKRTPAGVSAALTNPPFGRADAFIRHALKLGLPTIVLLRWQAAEGEGRSDIIDRHLRRVWLGRRRLPMMHRQGWDGPRLKTGGLPYAWFCFEPSPNDAGFVVKRINWGAP